MKLDSAITKVEEHIKFQDKTAKDIRLVMKHLFEITEHIAMKEINSDTKGFIRREMINRLS